MPSEIRDMTFPQVYELFEYWASSPPENECLAILLQVFTTWEPRKVRSMTEAEHRESLERRWNSGQYLNVKQLFEATGGVLRSPMAQDGEGGGRPSKPIDMGGIGPFPGAH